MGPPRAGREKVGIFFAVTFFSQKSGSKLLELITFHDFGSTGSKTIVI